MDSSRKLSATFSRLFDMNKQTIFQFLRFGIVGVLATVIHYGIYWILQRYMNASVAYTIGYALSFICNFYLTSIFTFRAKATVKRGLGFGGAHIVNYFLHIILLNIFLFLGMSNEWAPIPVFCLVVPINFLLIRFVFTKIKSHK